MAEEKQCVLVLIGADEWGRKEIIGLADGYSRLAAVQRSTLVHSYLNVSSQPYGTAQPMTRRE